MLDVDGNQSADALTDGILLIRYLFGLTGNSLISGAVADNATRITPADIEAHLRFFDLPMGNSAQLFGVEVGGEMTTMLI